MFAQTQVLTFAVTPRAVRRSSSAATGALVPASKRAFSRARGPAVVAISAPERQTAQAPAVQKKPAVENKPRVTREVVRSLELELDGGLSVPALKRFHEALENLPAEGIHERMKLVWNEFCYNLESFNPVFTAVLLKVQSTIGLSDYKCRDAALQHLIVPLAGEYGLAAEYKLGKTHRQLFADFYASVTGKSLDSLLDEEIRAGHAEEFFTSMITDVTTGGGNKTAMEQASYALGYNLAVEYVAAYEKTWMLEAFQRLNERVFAMEGKTLDWVFLEVHAVGEPMHAELGHKAVTDLVPAEHVAILRKGMRDHDRDMAKFYDSLTELLQ